MVMVTCPPVGTGPSGGLAAFVDDYVADFKNKGIARSGNRSVVVRRTTFDEGRRGTELDSGVCSRANAMM